MDEKRLDETTLAAVTGAGDPVIDVEIKTLPGDNDDYQVSPSDKIQELLKQYEKNKGL